MVFREVEARGSASVSQLAAATGLHENTVRGHLERLRADGYVRSEREPRVGRGRPTLQWCAVSRQTRDPYVGLAIALASTIAHSGNGSAELVRAAGVAWGESLAAEREPAVEREPAAVREPSIDLVFEVMREQGFSPEIVGAEAQLNTATSEMRLRACPILVAATGAPDVVCSIHRAMIEGLLGEGSGQVELLPFFTPETCMLRFQAVS